MRVNELSKQIGKSNKEVPGGRDYRWRRGHYDVYFYRREEGIIWGMTAKILRSLAEMYREDILLK